MKFETNKDGSWCKCSNLADEDCDICYPFVDISLWKNTKLSIGSIAMLCNNNMGEFIDDITEIIEITSTFDNDGYADSSA
jgi:hypothetical protein